MKLGEQPTPLRPPTRSKLLFAVSAVVLVIAILVLSFLPKADKHVLHTRGRFHSWGHLLAFMVVGFLLRSSARSLYGRLLLFVGALGFGVLIEFGEHVTFHSPMEWKDVFVDSLGVICGTLVAMANVPRSVKGRGEPGANLEL